MKKKDEKGLSEKQISALSEFRARVGHIEFIWGKFNGEFELNYVYKNPQYNAQEKMKKEGWELLEDGSMSKGICTYDSSCFVNPESSYVMAFVEMNTKEDFFDLRTVGTRPFDIKENEMKDMKKVIEYIKEKSKEICDIIRGDLPEDEEVSE